MYSKYLEVIQREKGKSRAHQCKEKDNALFCTLSLISLIH